MIRSPSISPSQLEGTSRTPGGSEALTFIMRVLGCGCLGHRGLLKIGARVSPTRMETRTVLRWTLKMRASGGWTWIAAKRITGCPTTLSVRRLFRHNCPIGLLENIILKQSKLIFIYGSHYFLISLVLETFGIILKILDFLHILKVLENIAKLSVIICKVKGRL